ncbi:hypothetical protein [Streptomyces sp. 1114.5]|uniref:hypothetical protein n=1 Tax=Streptomyces sp. 1114.5 TaxID=1938830 RepID=UPI0011C3B5EC|nr:hypothetical protein [Streptomyces sp. 1114.5]
MGELDDLRARLAALEAEVGRLREESASTRAGARATTPAVTATATEATEAQTTAAKRSRASKAARPTAKTAVETAVDRRSTGAVPDAGDRTRVPAAAPADRVEQPQSLTHLADAIGVMVSGRQVGQVGQIDQVSHVGQVRRANQSDRSDRSDRSDPTQQAEQTQVLRIPARALEARTISTPVAGHGQFLESLLSGQAVLPGEPHREGR